MTARWLPLLPPVIGAQQWAARGDAVLVLLSIGTLLQLLQGVAAPPPSLARRREREAAARVVKAEMPLLLTMMVLALPMLA